MNYAFSVDDFDALWHSPMEAPTPDVPFHAAGGGDREKMNRSSSEWEFQRFIQEASASPAASASSVVAGSPAAIERGDEDALEINNPPLPSRPPSAPVDSDEYQNYLKSRLQLACAAVAMSRGPTGKPQSSTPVDAKELDTNPTKLGSEAFGPGNGFSMEQHKADGKPLDVPALPALQKKSGGGTTTSESSREHSDDDDLEGDTGTTGNRYPADDRRARSYFVGQIFRGIWSNYSLLHCLWLLPPDVSFL